jgi:hypothetical protein
MSKFNILVSLQSYKDVNPTNNPSMSHFKWTREQQGLSSEKPISQELSLAPSENKTIFDGSRILNHDNTTVYSLSKKPLVSNTYVLSWESGTAPDFRTARTSGADATTEITLSKNGSLVVLESTDGTPLNLIAGGVTVGDLISLGSDFNIANQGVFKVLSVATTSLSFENVNAAPETLVLGANFASDIEIFGSSGVQVGDTMKISGGFSPVSRESFEITAVYSDRIEFFSSKTLPEELLVLTDDINIYSAAKKFIYIESSDRLILTINGTSQVTVEPFVEVSGNKPGMYFQKSTIWSLACNNDSINTATIYVAAIE